MKVYGLTGETGAGKSTVALYLKEKGFYVIDGDLIAREITLKGKPALKELADFFGDDIIDEDGNLIRSLLASRAFCSKENTHRLNCITHPHIYREFIEEINKAEKEGYEKALIDAAAILESECKNLCEKIIVVTAPEKLRLERILERDSITQQQALTRMRAQKDDEYYLSQADIIVRNYPPYEIKSQLSDI